MCTEYGINVPALACSYFHNRPVTCLPPRPDVFASQLALPPQRIRNLLVQAVQRIAVHIVSHFGLVNVIRSCFFGKPKHLVCHLYMIMYDEKLIITVCIYRYLEWTLENNWKEFTRDFLLWAWSIFYNLHKTKMKRFVNHIMGLEMIFSSIFFSKVSDYKHTGHIIFSILWRFDLKLRASSIMIHIFKVKITRKIKSSY